MIEFFQGLGNLISVLGDLLVSIFESLGHFVEYIAVGLGYANGFLDYLPAELTAIGAVVLSASLAYVILGR